MFASEGQPLLNSFLFRSLSLTHGKAYRPAAESLFGADPCFTCTTHGTLQLSAWNLTNEHRPSQARRWRGLNFDENDGRLQFCHDLCVGDGGCDLL